MQNLPIIFSLFLVSILVAGCQPDKESHTAGHQQEKNQQNQKASSLSPEIPASLQQEHQELHLELEGLLKLPGKTGAAAKKVAGALHHHFEKEEAYALPPLGLLTRLADGEITMDMKNTLELTKKLKADMPRMLEEHKQIVATLEELKKAASEEDQPEALKFAEKLMLHAQTEEQVLYPAAILVGEYLELKLK